jgi:hypothetical protein
MMSEPLQRWLEQRERSDEKARQRTVPVIALVSFFMLVAPTCCYLTDQLIGTQRG